MQITDTTPVIIAAGQVVDRLGEGWRRLSPADLAAEAVRTTRWDGHRRSCVSS